MDARSYCDNVNSELTGWKAKLYDVIRKTEKLPGDHKDKVAPILGELNTLIDDLNERISLLSRECPTEWASDKAHIDERMSKMQHKWKEVWGVLGEEEYGLGGA